MANVIGVGGKYPHVWHFKSFFYFISSGKCSHYLCPMPQQPLLAYSFFAQDDSLLWYVIKDPFITILMLLVVLANLQGVVKCHWAKKSYVEQCIIALLWHTWTEMPSIVFWSTITMPCNFIEMCWKLIQCRDILHCCMLSVLLILLPGKVTPCHLTRFTYFRFL